jgi:hypothetical protein
MNIFRSIEEPIRENATWDDRWVAEDQGLIACWERGRTKSKEAPALSSAARGGELVVLPWKGGVEKSLKTNKKYGTLSYLAMWQGLRGENLDINVAAEKVLVCARTKVEVTFTSDQTKTAEA